MATTPDQTQPQLQDATPRNRYEALVNGELAGFIDYRDAGAARELVHTEVLPQHEGRGLGGQLAAFALEDARQQDRKVVPACSFIEAYIRRHPHTADLVAGTSAE